MRESGILMHITSLPGPYGVGTMGRYAYEFVDFLKQAGQSYWQILPLSPTGYGDSPYQSCSTFAGNHYLIDLDLLVEEGLLKKKELENITWNLSETKVSFGLLYNHRLKVLSQAYGRFKDQKALDAFCKENSAWLPDFALFMAIKNRFGGKPWYDWDEDLKFRKPKAIEKAKKELAEEIKFYCFVQYLFFKQWTALRTYAHKQGIRIVGDVPIYVPYDSVDVWTNPPQFQMDEKLDPVAVAGCPPDGFTEDGQLWGNPLYRWDVMEKDGFTWWIKRLAAAGKMYDVVRLDHFRGLESYWSVPYGDKTARNGKWVKGPDKAFVEALKKGLPDLEMIAEDLGYMTQEVIDLRDFSGYPGMKVLQFAFDPKEPSDYLPHTYTHNTVCYTGTHDNMTMRQWFDTATEEEVALAMTYMHVTADEGPVWGSIRTAMASVSDICVIQMQDFVEFGGEARMNFPGTLSDSNWTWRAKYDIMSLTLSERIYKLTKLYGRCVDLK